ncbi:DEKNAAC102364 [Brettanomyces naardenensis]|uniref:DEKNAAC102364 n=1 Tax=Brettanomyces naardenensis TaxID=13370 RepID=A0A448YLB9_BRENA|nr:DEKNAAC102364 [Brettanomyces naardenensis]
MALKLALSTRIKSTYSKTKRFISHNSSSSVSSSLSSSSDSTTESGFSYLTAESSTTLGTADMNDGLLSRLPLRIGTKSRKGMPLVHTPSVSKKSISSSSRRHSSASALSSSSVHRKTRSRGGHLSHSSSLSRARQNSLEQEDTHITQVDHDHSQHNPLKIVTDSEDVAEEVILLPIDPIDKSVPPCTTEELTPIIPATLDELRESISFEASINADDIGSNQDGALIQRRRALIVSTLSTTSGTATLATSVASHQLSLSLEDITAGSSIQQTGNSAGLYSSLQDEDFKDHVDPVFCKANQIDHFDRSLDLKKNDKLADQMALNILHNIAEEEADELSKFKKEIPVNFGKAGRDSQ